MGLFAYLTSCGTECASPSCPSFRTSPPRPGPRPPCPACRIPGRPASPPPAVRESWAGTARRRWWWCPRAWSRVLPAAELDVFDPFVPGVTVILFDVGGVDQQGVLFQPGFEGRNVLGGLLVRPSCRRPLDGRGGFDFS